jgi:hypothetical protein
LDLVTRLKEAKPLPYFVCIKGTIDGHWVNGKRQELLERPMVEKVVPVKRVAALNYIKNAYTVSISSNAANDSWTYSISEKDYHDLKKILLNYVDPDKDVKKTPVKISNAINSVEIS